MIPLKYPYSTQSIDETDIEAVTQILRGDWLTTGPSITQFEKDLAQIAGAKEVVVVNSGTAALHLGLRLLDLQPGDEVITSPITFAATANAILYCGAQPVLADVHPHSGLLDPQSVEQKITTRTKAILTVDLAGQIGLSEEMIQFAKNKSIPLLQDSSHSLGAMWQGQTLGQLPSLWQTLSFHPVKQITTGEGGAILLNNPELADRLRQIRSHGLIRSPETSDTIGPWWYDIEEEGYNYRLTDLQAALGIAQLKRFTSFLEKRQAIATYYNSFWENSESVSGPWIQTENQCAHHLYQVRIDFEKRFPPRKIVMQQLRERGIGTQVHYIPLYKFKYFQNRLAGNPKDFPGAEDFYQHTLSLPCYPKLSEADIEYIANALLRLEISK